MDFGLKCPVHHDCAAYPGSCGRCQHSKTADGLASQFKPIVQTAPTGVVSPAWCNSDEHTELISKSKDFGALAARIVTSCRFSGSLFAVTQRYVGRQATNRPELSEDWERLYYYCANQAAKYQGAVLSERYQCGEEFFQLLQRWHRYDNPTLNYKTPATNWLLLESGHASPTYTVPEHLEQIFATVYAGVRTTGQEKHQMFSFFQELNAS